MADIRFSCPYCQQHFVCDSSMTGQLVACPSCGNNIHVAADAAKPELIIVAEAPKHQQNEQKPPQPAIEVVHYGPGYAPNSNPRNPNTGASFSGERKNRIVFIILGVLLGGLGIHNFYAGYNDDGKKQLCVTLILNLVVPVLCMLFLGLVYGIAVWSVIWLGNIGIFVWVVLDLVRKECDANGVPMEM